MQGRNLKSLLRIRAYNAGTSSSSANRPPSTRRSCCHPNEASTEAQQHRALTGTQMTTRLACRRIPTRALRNLYLQPEPVYQHHGAGASPRLSGCPLPAGPSGLDAGEGLAGYLARVGPASGSARAPATGAGGSRAKSRSAQGRWSSQRRPVAAQSSSQPPPPPSPCAPSHGPYSAATTCQRRAWCQCTSSPCLLVRAYRVHLAANELERQS